MKMPLAAALSIALLAGCSARVTPPSVEIEAKPVSVEVGSSGGSKFCPPGQAKKGRC